MTTTRPAIVIARAGAVRAALDRLDLSLRDMEAKSGVSRSTIANVIARKDYGIAKDKAEAIARVVGLPVGQLFAHRDGATLT